MVVRKHMQNGLQDGESAPKRFRQAREDDKFVIARDVMVSLPPIRAQNMEIEGIDARMLWSVKSKDIHVELVEQNLLYCFAALECSPPVEKKSAAAGEDADDSQNPQVLSPGKKKKRKLKKVKSRETEE